MTILSPWRDIDFRKLILSYKSCNVDIPLNDYLISTSISGKTLVGQDSYKFWSENGALIIIYAFVDV